LASGLRFSSKGHGYRDTDEPYGPKGGRYGGDRWDALHLKLEVAAQLIERIDQADPSRTQASVAPRTGHGVGASGWSGIMAIVSALGCAAAFFWGSWLVGLAFGFSAHLFVLGWLTTLSPTRASGTAGSRPVAGPAYRDRTPLPPTRASRTAGAA